MVSRGFPDGPTVNILSNFVDVMADGPCDASEDDMTLVVDQGGRDVLRQDFCSAYGHVDLRLETDAMGHQFILVTMREGHGTSATSAYLVIYQLKDGQLLEHGRHLVHRPIVPHGGWDYDYSRIDHPATGGLDIVMRLEVSEGTDPAAIPKARTKRVRIRPR